MAEQRQDHEMINIGPAQSSYPAPVLQYEAPEKPPHNPEA